MQILSFRNINLTFAVILTVLCRCLECRSIASMFLGVIVAKPYRWVRNSGMQY